MSVQVGAHYLEKEPGGRGVLLGGVPGVPAAKVVILGGASRRLTRQKARVPAGSTSVLINPQPSLEEMSFRRESF
jgi:alanine dehydrogenase